MDNQRWENFLSYLERPQRGQFDGSNANGTTAIDVANDRSDVPSIGTANDTAGTEALDLLERCRLGETENVVVLSSDSENDDDTIWSSYAKCKDYKRLWERARCLVFYRLIPKYYHCTSVSKEPYFMKTAEEQIFPYNKLKNLTEDLRKFQQDFKHNEEELNFLWENVLQWLLAINQSLYPIDAKYDEKFNLILIEFMVQYVNYITSIVSNFADEEKIRKNIHKIVQAFTVILSGNTFYALMVLLRIDLKLEYRAILDPIFRKYLTDPSLCHASTDLVVYLQVIFCFKRWKMITPLKTDRESINEIAVGKSLRKQRGKSEVTDLTTESILPKSVPLVNEKNKLFVSISDLIGFAMERKAFGTRILLVYTSLDLEDAIAKFLQMYLRYVSCNPGFGMLEVTTSSSRACTDILQPQYKESELMTYRKKKDASLRQQQHHQRKEQHDSNQQSRNASQLEKYPKSCLTSHEAHFEKNCDKNKNRLSNPSSYSVSYVSHSHTISTQSDISLSKSMSTSVNKNTELTQVNLTDSDDEDKIESNKNIPTLTKISDSHKIDMCAKNTSTLHQSETQKVKIQKSFARRHREKNQKENLEQVTETKTNDIYSESTIVLTSSSSSDDENSLIKYLKNSDSDTVSRQTTATISNETNALGLEQSLPRIAAIPPRCRPLVESVATKPTRKEKHCIPGEVSSTTSPDCGLQTNGTQSSQPAEEKETTSSSFQYNVSNLEVHSAGTLQNAREVGIVKAVQQRVSPCPPVVVSGTCKPGSLLLGIDYSDFSSDNEDLESEFGSHLLSHGSWKVVEEATSSTAEIPKTLSENITMSTRSDRSRIKSRVNSLEKISLPQNPSTDKTESELAGSLRGTDNRIEFVDRPTCSKYIENKSTTISERSRTKKISEDKIPNMTSTHGTESFLASTEQVVNEPNCVDKSKEEVYDAERTVESKYKNARSIANNPDKIVNDSVQEIENQSDLSKKTLGDKKSDTTSDSTQKVEDDVESESIKTKEKTAKDEILHLVSPDSEKNLENTVLLKITEDETNLQSYHTEKIAEELPIKPNNGSDELSKAAESVEASESAEASQSAETADIESFLKEIDENLNETAVLQNIKNIRKDDKFVDVSFDSKAHHSIPSMELPEPCLNANINKNVTDASLEKIVCVEQDFTEQEKKAENQLKAAEKKSMESSKPKLENDDKIVSITVATTIPENEESIDAINTSEKEKVSTNIYDRRSDACDIQVEKAKVKIQIKQNKNLANSVDNKDQMSKNSLLDLGSEYVAVEETHSFRTEETNISNVVISSKKESGIKEKNVNQKIRQRTKGGARVPKKEIPINSKINKDLTSIKLFTGLESANETVEEKISREKSSILNVAMISNKNSNLKTENAEQEQLNKVVSITTLDKADLRPLDCIENNDIKTCTDENLKDHNRVSENANLEKSDFERNSESTSIDDFISKKECRDSVENTKNNELKIIESDTLVTQDNPDTNQTDIVSVKDCSNELGTEECAKKNSILEKKNKEKIEEVTKGVEKSSNEACVKEIQIKQVQNEVEEETESFTIESELKGVSQKNIEDQVIVLKNPTNQIGEEHSQSDESVANDNSDLNREITISLEASANVESIHTSKNESENLQNKIQQESISNNSPCDEITSSKTDQSARLVVDNKESSCADDLIDKNISSKNIEGHIIDANNIPQTHLDEKEEDISSPSDVTQNFSQNTNTEYCINSVEGSSEISSKTITKVAESSEEIKSIFNNCENKSPEILNNEKTFEEIKITCSKSFISSSSKENSVLNIGQTGENKSNVLLSENKDCAKTIKDLTEKVIISQIPKPCLATSLEEKKESNATEQKMNEFNIETQILQPNSQEILVNKASEDIKHTVSKLSNRAEKIIEKRLKEIRRRTENKVLSTNREESQTKNNTQKFVDLWKYSAEKIIEERLKEIRRTTENKELSTYREESQTKNNLQKLVELSKNSGKNCGKESIQSISLAKQEQIPSTIVEKLKINEVNQSGQLIGENNENLSLAFSKESLQMEEFQDSENSAKISDETLSLHPNLEKQKEIPSTAVEKVELKYVNKEQIEQVQESNDNVPLTIPEENQEKEEMSTKMSDETSSLHPILENQKEIPSAVVEKVELKDVNKDKIEHSVKESNDKASLAISKENQEKEENSTKMSDETSILHPILENQNEIPSTAVEKVELKYVNRDQIEQQVQESNDNVPLSISEKNQEKEKNSTKMSDEISILHPILENQNEIPSAVVEKVELNDVNKDKIEHLVKESNNKASLAISKENQEKEENSTKMPNETSSLHPNLEKQKEISSTAVEKVELKYVSKDQIEQQSQESNDNVPLTISEKNQEKEENSTKMSDETSSLHPILENQKEIPTAVVEKVELKDVNKEKNEHLVKESNDKASLAISKVNQLKDHRKAKESKEMSDKTSSVHLNIEIYEEIPPTLVENQKLKDVTDVTKKMSDKRSIGRSSFQKQKELPSTLVENQKLPDNKSSQHLSIEKQVNKPSAIVENPKLNDVTKKKQSEESTKESNNKISHVTCNKSQEINKEEDHRISKSSTNECEPTSITAPKERIDSKDMCMDNVLENSQSSKCSNASGRGTPLLDEEPISIHKTDASEVLKNTVCTVFKNLSEHSSQSTEKLCKDNSKILDADVNSETTSSKQCIKLDIKKLSSIKNDLEKRTHWKRRIKRRISLCSDINKELDFGGENSVKEQLNSNFIEPIDNIHSSNSASNSSMAKDTDELAVNISKLSIKRHRTCSESDQSETETDLGVLKKPLFGNLGLLNRTESDMVSETNLRNSEKNKNILDKVEGRRKKQKVVKHVVEISSTSKPLELMPNNYNVEELAAITALMNLQNKCTIKTDEEVKDLGNKYEKADSEEGTTEPSRNSRVSKTKAQSTNCTSKEDETNATSKPIKPILKSALKISDGSNRHKVTKKVKYDEASILHFEKHCETRQGKKAFQNLKKTRSEEGALLKGGNKNMKKRLAEINARFEQETKNDVKDLHELSSSIETEKMNRTSTMGLRNKNKISEVLEKPSISPSRKALENTVSKLAERIQGTDVNDEKTNADIDVTPECRTPSLECTAEISKPRRGRKKKVLLEPVIDIVKPAISVEPSIKNPCVTEEKMEIDVCTESVYPDRLASKENAKDLTQNKSNNAKNETLSPILPASIELPMKISSDDKKINTCTTEISDVPNIGDESKFVENLPQVHDIIVLPSNQTEQNVAPCDSITLPKVKDHNERKGIKDITSTKVLQTESKIEENSKVEIQVERLSQNNDIQESRRKSLKLKKAFVKMKRATIPKQTAIFSEVKSSKAVISNPLLQESQIKKEPIEEFQSESHSHNTIDIEIKAEEESLDTDKFSQIQNDFSFTENADSLSQAQTSRKEIIVRPCDVILTADIINAQAVRLTEIAKEKRKVKKRALSGVASIRKIEISSKITTKNATTESNLKSTTTYDDKNQMKPSVSSKRLNKSSLVDKSKEMKKDHSKTAGENISENKKDTISQKKINDSCENLGEFVKSKKTSSIENCKAKSTDVNICENKAAESLLEKETLIVRNEINKSNQHISTKDSKGRLTAEGKTVPCENKDTEKSDNHLSPANDVKDLNQNKKQKTANTKRSASSQGMTSDGDDIPAAKSIKIKTTQEVYKKKTPVEKGKASQGMTSDGDDIPASKSIKTKTTQEVYKKKTPIEKEKAIDQTVNTNTVNSCESLHASKKDSTAPMEVAKDIEKKKDILENEQSQKLIEERVMKPGDVSPPMVPCSTSNKNTNQNKIKKTLKEKDVPCENKDTEKSENHLSPANDVKDLNQNKKQKTANTKRSVLSQAMLSDGDDIPAAKSIKAKTTQEVYKKKSPVEKGKTIDQTVNINEVNSCESLNASNKDSIAPMEVAKDMEKKKDILENEKNKKLIEERVMKPGDVPSPKVPCSTSNKNTNQNNIKKTLKEKDVPCEDKDTEKSENHLSPANDVKDLNQNKKQKTANTKRTALSQAMISDGDDIPAAKSIKTQTTQEVYKKKTPVEKGKEIDQTVNINTVDSCESLYASKKDSTASMEVAKDTEKKIDILENEQSQKLIEEGGMEPHDVLSKKVSCESLNASKKDSTAFMEVAKDVDKKIYILENEQSPKVSCTTSNKNSNQNKIKKTLKEQKKISKPKLSHEKIETTDIAETCDLKTAPSKNTCAKLANDMVVEEDKTAKQTSSGRSNNRSTSSTVTVCEVGEKEAFKHMDNADATEAIKVNDATNKNSECNVESNKGTKCKYIETPPIEKEERELNNKNIDSPGKTQNVDCNKKPNDDKISTLCSKDVASDKVSRPKNLNIMSTVPTRATQQKSAEVISKETIESDESADKITECVIAELKLLSPQNTLEEQSPRNLDPDVEIAKTLDQGIELVLGNKIENEAQSQNTSNAKRNSIDDKEKKTAALLDSAIEQVLGNSANTITQTSTHQPKTTIEHLDFAIDAILGARNTYEAKAVSSEVEGTKIKSPTKCKLGILTAEKINSSIEKLLERDRKTDLDHKTAETLNQSIEKILGQCVAPVEEGENKAIESTNASLLKKNSAKPEDVSTKKPINKKYFTDMKIISANVPEALFADDDSDNSNSGENSGPDNLKFFPPILSLDDLLNKKTEHILKIPCCGNSDDCNCNSEISERTEEPSIGTSRQCLGMPNFAIELEVETSQKSNADEENDKETDGENATDKVTDTSVNAAVELPANLVEVNTTNMENFVLSDISTIGIPIDFNMTNESFPDVMDIMLLDQVQQSIGCVIPGNNYVQKWSNESYRGQGSKKNADEKSSDKNHVPIPVPSEQDNICISEILESNPSVDNSPCGSTLGIGQEINYSSMNPLDEVEVSTTIGFDLVGNVTVEDLLANDGDDLFAFSELDKTRSRTNSYSNDSETALNPVNEPIENIALTTKVIACDHSYNKEIEEKDAIKTSTEQSPNKGTSPKTAPNLVTIGKTIVSEVKKSPPNSFTKLKSHPTPFWIRKNDLKTSTPKRSSSSDEPIEDKDLPSEEMNSLSTKADLSHVQKKLFYNMPELDLAPCKPKPKIIPSKSESCLNKPIILVETPANTENHNDSPKIVQTTDDSSPMNAQQELKPIEKRVVIEITEMVTISAPSPISLETITTTIEENQNQVKTNIEAEPEKSSSRSSTPSEITDPITPLPTIITQPIITIQSQTNRLQRVTSVSNQFPANNEYTITTTASVNCTPNREPTPTLDEPNKDSLDDSDELFNEIIEDTRKNVLKRGSTPTMDEPPEKKLCLDKSPKEFASKDKIFDDPKRKSSVDAVAAKRIVENKVVSEASSDELLKEEFASHETEEQVEPKEEKKEVNCVQLGDKAELKKSLTDTKNKCEVKLVEHTKEKTADIKTRNKETKTKTFAENPDRSKESKFENKCSLIDGLDNKKSSSKILNSSPVQGKVDAQSPIKVAIKSIPAGTITALPKIAKRRDSAVGTSSACKQDSNKDNSKLSTNTTVPEVPIRKMHTSTSSSKKSPYAAPPNVKSISSPSSSKTPPAPNSRPHPYHNSPTNDRANRNKYNYQRVASSSEMKYPNKSNSNPFNRQLQHQQHKQTDKPMADKRSQQFMPSSGYKSTPSTSSHSNLHKNSTNSGSIVSSSSFKLSAADEAELRTKLDAFQKTLPQTKIYKEHKEQQLLLKLQEEKLRLQYLEKEKLRLEHLEKEKRKQAPKLLPESQRPKRKSNSESYEGQFKKFAFGQNVGISNSRNSSNGSGSCSSSSIPSHHRQVHQHQHQQQHSHKQQHNRQKYVNKFGEIEKKAAISRNNKDIASSKTPLTITTAWEHKSASVDEIIEHLAKMKKP